jgi:hypothetical protein
MDKEALELFLDDLKLYGSPGQHYVHGWMGFLELCSREQGAVMFKIEEYLSVPSDMFM